MSWCRYGSTLTLALCSSASQSSSSGAQNRQLPQRLLHLVGDELCEVGHELLHAAVAPQRLDDAAPRLTRRLVGARRLGKRVHSTDDIGKVGLQLLGQDVLDERTRTSTPLAAALLAPATPPPPLPSLLAATVAAAPEGAEESGRVGLGSDRILRHGGLNALDGEPVRGHDDLARHLRQRCGDDIGQLDVVVVEERRDLCESSAR
jgi:hypothetical protein